MMFSMDRAMPGDVFSFFTIGLTTSYICVEIWLYW